MRKMILILLLLLALGYAYRLRWVAEDAYISFRYARNLVEGKGLVFNEGEKVEGYTNFLWTMLLAGGLRIGLSPITISTGLGLICTGITFLFLAPLHQKLFANQLWFPASLFALAANYTWACFSTSGLETSLVTMLIVASVCFLFQPETKDTILSSKRAFGVGLLLTFAIMTRPDAVLGYAVIAVYLIVRTRNMICFAFFLLPMLFIYLPYFLWRHIYYGYLLPNTFYAKSAGLVYYHQGLIYLWEFILRYSLWIFLPLVALILLRRKSLPNHGFMLMMSTLCLLHIVYVVYVGGDFMEGRFFVPVLPFLYLIFEYLIRNSISHPNAICALLVALVLSAIFDRPQIEPRRISQGIADERTWMPVTQLWYLEGDALRKHLPIGTVIATDAVGAFGYASRLPVIDTLGLTDAHVAHLPLEIRSRPGHEKTAPMDYLQRRNVAVLRDGMGLYDLKRPSDWAISNNRYYLLTNDPAIRTGFHHAKNEILRSLKTSTE